MAGPIYLGRKKPQYKLKDPTGKTVGYYVTIKGARKKGYDLQNGRYSRYDVMRVRTDIPVGYIGYSLRGYKGAYWHEDGKAYYIRADGAIHEAY